MLSTLLLFLTIHMLIISFNSAAIYVATFVVSFVYWTFDDMKNGKGMFCRRRSARPAHSSLDQAKYGGKYGAVKTDI